MRPPDRRHRKRIKHYDNGDAHFLTLSCFRRMPLLSKDRTRRWFLESLNDARKIHRFELWAWVIMPEHVHLLLWPNRSLSVDDRRVDDAGRRRRSKNTRKAIGAIAGILADIKRPVGAKAIAYLEQCAPEFLQHLTVRNRNRTYRRFWQAGPGYDKNISEIAALHEIVEYIHNNPVRRGLTTRAEDWDWSSAREWCGLATESHCHVDRRIPPSLEIPAVDRRIEV